MSFLLPPLNPLKAFETVARCGSVSKAAEELGVTNAAIGQQIRTIESYFGVVLLQRGHTATMLTREGQELYAGIAQSFLDIDFAVKQASKVNDQQRLVIRSYLTLTRFWLFPRIAGFHRLHPNIELEIRSLPPPIVEVDVKNLDAVFRVGNGSWKTCDFLKVAPMDLVPVCTKNYLESNSISEVGDIRNAVLLASLQRPDDWNLWLNTFNKGASSPRVRLYETSILSYEAAIAGLGIALAVRSFIEPQLERGDLICPFDKQLRLDQAFYLTWKTGGKTTPYLDRFVEWIESAGLK